MPDVDYGPQADAVHAIEERFKTLTKDEKQRMRELQDDAFWAGWNAVVIGGRANRAGLWAARLALVGRLIGFHDGDAAYGAALAVLLRHTITDDEWVHYDALVKPWVLLTGQLAHPDDFQDHDPRPWVAVEPTPVGDELDAIATMVDLFKSLDADARARVFVYIGDRFGVSA